MLAFLPYAMAFEHDIIIHGAVSERLFYQLKNYYIPSLSKFTNGYYKSVTITPERLDGTCYVSEETHGVGTGFSAGVDSFYTVLKHLDIPEKSFELTHLTFFKVGATGSFGGQKADATFKHRVEKFKGFAEEHGLKLVTVDSNISEHAIMSYNYIHTFRSMSAVLALQKLFGKYYYSSATVIGDFAFNVVDAANYDFFNLKNFSVEGMELYSVGLDCERMEKQRFIQDFSETYELLNVCNNEAENCCRCEKCIRTMVGFYCMGTLDRYAKAFDVEYFKKNFGKCAGLLIGKQFDGTAEGDIDRVLIRDMKKKGIHIPISAYFHAVPTAFKSLTFRAARSIKPVRKWYHKRMHDKLGFNYVD